MDPEKFLELQKQMRQNNQEVADFLNDFGNWKEQVESKEARLKGEKHEGAPLPAVRNSLFKKQKKKRNVEVTNKPGKGTEQRIRSSDYSAWDKFDVDKALEEVDKSDHVDELKENSSGSETDEELENRRRMELSKDARELGNLRFKEGKFQEAVEQYTNSVRLTPEDPIPYTNRALAFLKLERYASAEADCSTALALDNKCAKALFRRALARKGLQKKNDAVEDLNQLLASDPTNKAALRELTLLTGKPPGSLHSDSPAPGQSLPVAKTSLRGSRKLRRIPIVEVGGGISGENITGKPAIQARVDSTYPSGDTGTPLSPLTKPTFSSVPSKVPETAVPVIKNLNSLQNNQQNSTSKLSSEAHAQNLLSTGPSNWYQLERDLRELSGSDRRTLSKEAVDYLCALPPDSYSKIISSNLEPSFLSQLLYALHSTTQLRIDEVATRLHALSELPRFDVAWCLADNHERDLFRQLFARIQAAPDVSDDVKLRLRTQYD